MAWFPLAQLPVVHWSDNGAVVEPEVIHAWLIAACKLKLAEPKGDALAPFQSRKELQVPEFKSEASNVKADPPEADKGLPRRANALPPKMARQPSNPSIDPAKVNMSKANSKAEVQLEVVGDKPALARPPTRSNSSRNLVPLNKPGCVANNRQVESFEKMVNSEAPQRNGSQKQLAVRQSPAEGRAPVKNVPPSPPTRMDAIKRDNPVKAESGNGGVPARPLSRNNSASANRLLPVAVEKGTPLRRQDSARNLSTDKSGSKAQTKSAVANVVAPPPPTARANDRQPPLSLKAVKRPPLKSGQPSPNDSNRPSRFSTNPSNEVRTVEGGEKVMKFDDFIRNFEGSNGRLSRLQAQRDEQMKERGGRFSSLKQKSRS